MEAGFKTQDKGMYHCFIRFFASQTGRYDMLDLLKSDPDPESGMYEFRIDNGSDEDMNTLQMVFDAYKSGWLGHMGTKQATE